MHFQTKPLRNIIYFTFQCKLRIRNAILTAPSISSWSILFLSSSTNNFLQRLTFPLLRRSLTKLQVRLDIDASSNYKTSHRKNMVNFKLRCHSILNIFTSGLWIAHSYVLIGTLKKLNPQLSVQQVTSESVVSLITSVILRNKCYVR